MENRNFWEGVYNSFSEIEIKNDDVFEGDVWLDKVHQRAVSLLEKESSTNVSDRLVTTSEYALPFIVATCLNDAKTCHILDFGGGLGTSYIPLKSMLRENANIEFDVVENEILCEKGKELFGDDNNIQFYNAIPEAKGYDIAHAGSSMQYIENWQEGIGALAKTGAEYILFADLLAGDIKTFATTQCFYGKKIPSWFWNLQEFIEVVETFEYELILKAAYRGYYLEQGASLPTTNFALPYRLNQTCQLVFRKKHSSSD